jgi:tyrosinase
MILTYLLVTARYGPDSSGNIYVPTPAGIKQHPHDPHFGSGTVTDVCMSNDLYTGHDASTKPPGFGGPVTPFWHGGHTPSGNLEGNPHNLVHVYVGGFLSNSQEGLMSDPGVAGLDPIFYLHHANIDRMWAAWNSNPKNTNPTDPNWLNGPTAVGERKFVMPMPDGTSWTYTPQQMSSLSLLDYTYDSLQTPASTPAPALLAQRLTQLGATAAAAKVKEGATVDTGTNMELVGATQRAIPIKGSGATATVRLDAGVLNKVSSSLALASETAAPDRVYLNLEDVRGTFDASVLSVYINLPKGANPGDHPELLAGSVALFGLRRASFEDGQHGGGGLSFVLDITKIVDALHVNNALNVDSLQVSIVPNRSLPDNAQITVGRVSIYREGL